VRPAMDRSMMYKFDDNIYYGFSLLMHAHSFEDDLIDSGNSYHLLHNGFVVGCVALASFTAC
jgi:hypothetical protein